MTLLYEILSDVALCFGWAFMIIGGTLMVVSLLVSFLERILSRTGFSGIFLKFCMQEFHKDQRGFWATLLWGAKEEDQQ